MTRKAASHRTVIYILYVIFCNISIYPASLAREKLLEFQELSLQFTVADNLTIILFAVWGFLWFAEHYFSKKTEKRIVLPVRIISLLFMLVIFLWWLGPSEILYTIGNHMRFPASVVTGYLLYGILELCLLKHEPQKTDRPTP